MKTKTLHFKVADITRTQGHNAVAACAYRVGLNLTDAKTGEVHRYARRGGVLTAKIFAPGAAPVWMQDDNTARGWERLGNEIERTENGHNKRASAMLAKDIAAAAPRELSHLLNWQDVGERFARKVNARGLAVAVAFHETDASDGGKNPHFHFLIVPRLVSEQGFEGRYRPLSGRPGAPVPEIGNLRREYFACVNEALADAGIEGIYYDPEKQEDKLSGVHKGRAVVALERKGIATQEGKASRRVALENRARPFYAGLEQTAERVFSNEPGANAMEKLHNGMNRMREAEYAGRAALGGTAGRDVLPVVVASVPAFASEPAPAAPATSPRDAAPASSWLDYVTKKDTEPDRER